MPGLQLEQALKHLSQVLDAALPGAARSTRNRLNKDAGRLTQVQGLLVARRCWDLLHNRVGPLGEDLELLASDPPPFPAYALGFDYTKLLACQKVCLPCLRPSYAVCGSANG